MCVCLPGDCHSPRVKKPWMVSPLPLFLSALTFGGTARAPPSSLSHLVWDAQEREGGGKDPAGGQILALPAPGCSPHHPPDLLTQGLQCEQVTQAWQPVGTVNKSRVLCRWEQRAHSSHTRILTVPEHSAGCHSFGPLPVLPFQTEMSFDAISLFP